MKRNSHAHHAKDQNASKEHNHKFVELVQEVENKP